MGGIRGLDWDGLGKCQYVGVCLCVYVCVCVECGEMCNLKRVMCPYRQSSTAFALRIPPEGSLPA